MGFSGPPGPAGVDGVPGQNVSGIVAKLKCKIEIWTGAPFEVDIVISHSKGSIALTLATAIPEP